MKTLRCLIGIHQLEYHRDLLEFPYVEMKCARCSKKVKQVDEDVFKYLKLNGCGSLTLDLDNLEVQERLYGKFKQALKYDTRRG